MADSILGKILAAVDNTKRVVGRNVSDAVKNPADFLAMITGQLDKRNKKLASGDIEAQIEEGLNWLSGGAGIIRAGGAADLNMFHGSSNWKLARLFQEYGETPQLTHPSVAISSNNANPFQEEIQLLLNPSYKGFDPANVPLNQLFNTDAWVTRNKSLHSQHHLSGEDFRLSEGEVPRIEHALAILASPRFDSFAEFERGSLGAAKLRTTPIDQAHKIKASESAVNRWIRDAPDVYKAMRELDLNSADGVKELYQLLQTHLLAGEPSAKNVYKRFATVPSTYAELKMVGDLPLNANTVSAAIINNLSSSYSKELYAHTRQEMSDRLGLPQERIGFPKDILPADMQDTYKILTETLTKKVEKELKPGGDMGKLMGDPYMWTVAYTGAKEAAAEGKLYEYVGKSVVESPEFAADVASILTSRSIK